MIYFCDYFFIAHFYAQIMPTCILIVENRNMRQSKYLLLSRRTLQGHFSEEMMVFSLLFTLPDINTYSGVLFLHYFYLINSMENYEKKPQRNLLYFEYLLLVLNILHTSYLIQQNFKDQIVTPF